MGEEPITMAAETNAKTRTQEEETYRYLEHRADSWRRQPYLKGRRMTVANVVYGMRAYKLTPEEAAEDFDLPLEQIQEALLYYQRHPEIVQQDQDEERRYLESMGCPIDPPAVPR
jgi:uncharacterized protein (DUF433 family)